MDDEFLSAEFVRRKDFPPPEDGAHDKRERLRAKALSTVDKNIDERR
ncbi:MAG: hypothetical protein N3B10_02435 [Armatimonadetes bacterium]|nr:hypothetical protein [Armatimonadota bacterium]MCX7967328.1 hypothetical protein [Armatimonadota bacterium]MDW8142520.1 hypothetical protein [Armatimonadota bacterium]